MADTADHFEMRRLEALSNTIFGVAMTLLAYNFPKGDTLFGSPIWSTIWTTYQAQFNALLISFVVAGMFWYSHQRRLAYLPYATRPVVYLNLLFLLVVILLPVTTGLYGTYNNARDIIVLYSCHLTALAALSSILWLLAGLPRGEPNVAIPMTFATAVFGLSILFALTVPQTSIPQLTWCFGFATPIVDRIMSQRRRKRAI